MSALVRSARRLSALLSPVVRYRYPILAAAAVAIGIFDSLDKAYIQDAFFFARVGEKLFSPRWADVFADPGVQVGPMQLLVSGALGKVARWIGSDLRLPLAIFSESICALGVAYVIRMVLRDRGLDLPGAELAGGAAAMIAGVGYTAFRSGQGGEAIIGMLWILAGFAALREGRLAPALLIGIATAIKPIGLLGLPVLLLNREPMTVAIRSASATALGAAFYAPFIVFGKVSMLHWRWLIFPDRAVRILYGDHLYFTWQGRVFQAAAMLAVGIALVLLHRSSPATLWAVPLGIAATRLLSDPQIWSHYWLPVQVSAVVGATASIASRPSPVAMRIAVAASLAVIAYASFGGSLLAASALAVAIGAAALRGLSGAGLGSEATAVKQGAKPAPSTPI